MDTILKQDVLHYVMFWSLKCICISTSW